MAGRRVRALVGLAVAAAALSGCAGGAPPAGPADAARPAPEKPVAAPTWKPGDRWVFEWTSGKDSGTKTVEVVELRDLNGVGYYVVRLGDSQNSYTPTHHWYTRTLHWAAAIRESRVEARMVPPHPWFSWPLTAGARWTHQGRFETSEGTAAFNDRFAVIGPELVEVPAGRYEAVKLVRETDRRDGDEYWYAPDVRWYVRWLGRRGDTHFEERLREYQAASGPR
jgi:hypothetical protein